MESLTHRSSYIIISFRRTAEAYFRPLIKLIEYIGSTENQVDSKTALIEEAKASALAAQVMAKAICLNQGQYLQYTFLAADRHRKLKEEVSKANINLRIVDENARELVNFMNQTFYDVAQENFELLHAYFSKRSRLKPRICLKGNFRIGTSDRVVTVFRDSPVNYSSNVEIDGNSGFAHVQKTGTYFLENDLALAASKGTYLNPRLDSDLVKKKIRKGKIDSSTWLSCWTDTHSVSDAYRSTLIIPLTLWNNQIKDEFKRLVRISDVGRTIFGYLCIDHSEANYFLEKEDVKVGYAFADILSMYIFTRTVNIEVSNTFETAERLLKNEGGFQSATTLSESEKSWPNKNHHKPTLEFKISGSTNNSLFSLDSDLLRFVGVSDRDHLLSREDFVTKKAHESGGETSDAF
jgi:hypothetical protein